MNMDLFVCEGLGWTGMCGSEDHVKLRKHKVFDNVISFLYVSGKWPKSHKNFLKGKIKYIISYLILSYIIYMSYAFSVHWKLNV